MYKRLRTVVKLNLYSAGRCCLSVLQVFFFCQFQQFGFKVPKKHILNFNQNQTTLLNSWTETEPVLFFPQSYKSSTIFSPVLCSYIIRLVSFTELYNFPSSPCQSSTPFNHPHSSNRWQQFHPTVRYLSWPPTSPPSCQSLLPQL